MADEVAILPPTGPRKILHVDMDAFYASVEQRDRPELRGRAVVVGGSPHSRGVVCAASYEARRSGVRSAMACAHAHRLCPDAVFVAPDFARYSAESARIQAIFHRYTDLVQPLSLDEAFLDVTANKLGEPVATRIAERIRADIRGETGLTASAGVGPNKLVAKIACDRGKPDGLTVVPPARVAAFLAPLPAACIPGIGPKTVERLRGLGLATIADLRRAPDELMQRAFGGWWREVRALCEGVDDRPVQVEHGSKSVGIEDTFDRDIDDLDLAAGRLVGLAEGLERRLRQHGLAGRTVTLKVKYHDFRRISRSLTLSTPIDDAETLARVATSLLAATEVGRVAVRLLGIAVSHLDDSGARQEELPFGGDVEGAS